MKNFEYEYKKFLRKNCSCRKGRKNSYGYDENGRLVKTIRANGTVETRAYDKAGRLTETLELN